MSERERLVAELEKLRVVYDHGEDGKSKPQELLIDEIEVIADFVIADRRRVLDEAMKSLVEAICFAETCGDGVDRWKMVNELVERIEITIAKAEELKGL